MSLHTPAFYTIFIYIDKKDSKSLKINADTRLCKIFSVRSNTKEMYALYYLSIEQRLGVLRSS